MGCNCGKGAAARALVRQQTVTGSSGDSVLRDSGAIAGRMRSRVRFFVSPPPEDESGVEELAFGTLYEARAALALRDGWHLESRRVEVSPPE
jgi:hypothetical protein